MKFGIPGILISIAVVLLCAFPPIFVEQTTQSSRIAWLGFLFTLVVVAGGKGLAHYYATGRVMDSYSGAYARRHFKLWGTVLLSLFSITIALLVAFANLKDSSGWLGSTAKLLPTIVDPIFPWIQRFRHAYVLSPNSIQAIKVEAIMSLSFIFGCIVATSYSIYFGFMPKAERKSAARQAEKYQGSRSKIFMFFAIIFGIYCASSAYLGWGEFVPPTAPQFCFLHAPCYINNDLTIIIAAGSKFFAIFGFGLGSMIFLYKLFTEPEMMNDGGPKDIRNM